MAYVIAALLLLPAGLAIAYSAVNMFMWLKARKGATVGSDLLVGALGIASAFVPKLMSPDARKYLLRAFYGFGFLVLYSLLLFILVGKT